MPLYHYTSDAGARGIEETGQLYHSSSSSTDATFGEGVYLTDLPPSTVSVLVNVLHMMNINIHLFFFFILLI